MTRPPPFPPDSIRLVLFDMAGTTVRDGSGGGSVVVGAFGAALLAAGVQVTEEEVAAVRGRDKREAVRRLLEGAHAGSAGADLARSASPGAGREAPDRAASAATGPEAGTPATEVSEEAVSAVLEDFLARLRERLSDFQEMQGTREIFRLLHHRGIRVGVGSGFPRELLDALLARFGWVEEGLVDYAESSETLGAGRPNPRMVLDAMSRFGIGDPRQVLKVGDTAADIREGRNAGAWTCAVLSGTQREATLREAGPDLVLGGMAELAVFFEQAQGEGEPRWDSSGT